MTNRLGVSQDQTPDAKGVEPLHGIAQPAPSWGSSVTATKLPEDLSEAISWAQAKIISESSQESQVAQAPVKPEDLEALVLSVAKSPIGKNLSGVAPETTSPKLTETDSSGQDTSTQQISNGKTDELPAKGRHQTQGDEVKIQTQSPEKVKIPVQKLATAFAAEELQGTLLDDREPAIENEVKTTYAEGARTAHASPEKVANMIGEKSEITIDSRVSAPGFVKTIGDQMADRIAELAAHQKPGRIVIRLTPEDLGSITLAVKSSGTKLDVEIQASHESVRHALVNHKQDLLQVVEGKGLSMSSFDVRQDSQGQPGQSQHQDQSMRETFEQAIRLNQTESPRATSPLTINEISSHHKGWEVRA
jgi:flagellar hook-length control protein FliK